jgi:hypothetical protein
MRAVPIAIAALLACALFPRGAAADELETCIAAHASAQRLRMHKKLREARDQLLTCSSAECPSAIVTECGSWLEEVDARIPTLVVLAKDARGNDLVDVEVWVDDERVQQRLDGRAFPLDPGRHQVELRTADFGKVRRELLINEGEKARKLEVTFNVGGPAAPPAAKPTSRPVAEARPIPWPVYALAGVGVVGLGAGAYFAISGRTQHDDLLAANCKPNCSKDSTDEVDRKYLFADIAFGVSVVALSTATVLFVTRPTETMSLQPELGWAPGGASAGLRGRF